MSIRRALEILGERSPAAGDETVDLMSALGRVIAQEVVSPRDLPSSKRSRLDGYAVRSEDVAGPGRRARPLTVIGEVAAGSGGELEVPPGTAVRVSTGSVLPERADAVVPLEAAVEAENGCIRVTMGVAPGENVVQPGEDVRENEKLIQIGSKVGATKVAILAALGVKAVRVFLKPRIAVIVTGSELTGSPQGSEDVEYLNSNGPMVAAMAVESGADAIALPVIPDDSRLIASTIEAHLGSELIIVTGGTGLGRFDLTARALESIEATTLFSGIKMRPGASCRAAIKGKTVILSLPGNPGAVSTLMDVLVKPLIRRMSGLSVYERRVTVRAVEAMTRRPGVMRCVRGWIWCREGILYGKPCPTQSSLFGSIAEYNGYMFVPAGTGRTREGDIVEAVLAGRVNERTLHETGEEVEG